MAESPEAVLTRMRNLRLLRIVGAKVDTYHDRILHSVLERMEGAARRRLHLRLAEVVQGTSGGLSEEEVDALATGRGEREPGNRIPRVYDLAYHFDAAGEQTRALAFALVAATQARAQYANDVAAQQYAIAQRNAVSAPANVRFRISRGRGEALLLLGRYDEADLELDNAMPLAGTGFDIADVGGLQGELASKRGRIAESIDHLRASLLQLGVRIPQTRLGVFWSLLKETTVHLIHRCFPWRLHRRKPNAAADLANLVLGKLEYDYYCNNVLYLLWASFVGLNRAERLPPSKALAFNYVVHANDMAVLGWHSRAKRWYEAAMALSGELNDHWGAAHALNHFALGCLGAARYRETIEKATPGTEAFAKLGDLLEMHFAHFNVGLAYFGLGQLVNSIEKARWTFESCVRQGDNTFGPMAFCLWARARRGDLPFDELVGCLQILPGNNNGSISVLMAEGYWHLHHGRTAAAVEVFEQSWKIARTNTYVVTFNSWVLTDFVMALRVHAEAGESQKTPEYKSHCRRWRKLSRWAVRLSRFLPTERPAALRESSLVYASRGRFKKAWKLAGKSCRIAEKQNAQYQYAKSLLVQGQMAKQLGQGGADEQIREALAEITDRCAIKFKCFPVSIPPGRRRIGLTGASVGGGRGRGGIARAILRGRGRPGCASRRASGGSSRLRPRG